MTVPLFAQIPAPEISWAAISPELVLFGFGILVLLLETAGEDRLRASAVAFALLTAAAVFAALEAQDWTVPGLVILVAVAQLGLTLVWRHRPRLLSALLTALGFGATLGVVGWQWVRLGGGPVLDTASTLSGMVAVDGVALFTRAIICISGLLTVPLGWAYLEERRVHRGEYYPLLAFAATGMNLLAASADLIMVFISIEILSLSLYILSAFAKRDLNSQESGFKYLLLGAFSSAVLLYGVALAYGAAGSTNIAEVGRALTALDTPRGLAVAAMALLLVGFAFKTALVPFHMWTPDVYQGAPTPVTGFMAAATKAAAFAAFLRVFVGALAELQWSWVPVVWVVAVITMLAGAILAVVQTDLKRMLGYSAIAHAGYVLVGLVSVNQAGISGVLFYLLAYALMSLGAFGVLSLLERRTHKAVQIADLSGLGRSLPVPAGMLALFLLSLAGIPGTAGFMAKFAVFRAGLEAGHAPLVVVAVVSSLIAAFFYLRVIVAMFMEDPLDVDEPISIEPTTGGSAGVAAAAAAVLVLGIVPAAVVELATQAASIAG